MMEQVILITLAVLFAAVILSTVAQRTPQPPQVVYIRAEQLDALRTPSGDGGIAVMILVAVVVVAIWLL